MAVTKVTGYNGPMPEQQQGGAGDLVSVYEVLNETRGELYIGTTWRLKDLEDFSRMTPPAATRHWEKGDALRFRTIENGIPNADAPAFVAAYSGSNLVSRWRVLVDGRAG